MSPLRDVRNWLDQRIGWDELIALTQPPKTGPSRM